MKFNYFYLSDLCYILQNNYELSYNYLEENIIKYINYDYSLYLCTKAKKVYMTIYLKKMCN